MSSFTLRALFDSKIHLGHLSRFREPKMAPFIYGIKNGMSIINLEETQARLTAALQFISQLSERPGSKILFVGTKRAAQTIIKEQATRAMMPYVDRHWLGGMLTNYRTIRQSVKRLKTLETMQQDSNFKGLTKKEGLTLQNKLSKLQQNVGGIKDMTGLPDALFIIDIGHHHIAVSEAKKLRIPIIAVVDTNHSPEGIDYVIPGNDDAASAIQIYATLAADAVIQGQSARQVPEPVAAKPEPVIKTAKRAPIPIHYKKSVSDQLTSTSSTHSTNQSNAQSS